MVAVVVLASVFGVPGAIKLGEWSADAAHWCRRRRLDKLRRSSDASFVRWLP